MYKPTIWQDHVEGVQEGTSMNAANFNNIEKGAMEANALAAMQAAFQKAAGVSPVLESSAYPGCFFRLVTETNPEGQNVTREEWINPPMESCVEYRTTERCMGEPVYVQALRYPGAIDTVSPTHISTAFDNIDILNGMYPLVLSLTGSYRVATSNNDGREVHSLNDNMATAVLCFEKGYVRVEAMTDISNALVVIKYVKMYPAG